MKTIKSILNTKFTVKAIIIFALLATAFDMAGTKLFTVIQDRYNEYRAEQALEKFGGTVVETDGNGNEIKEVVYATDENGYILIDNDGHFVIDHFVY